MDASELAQKMLAWEQAKQALDALTAEIETAVLEIGKTQTVGNVRATFTGGRTTYDYETAGKAENYPDDVLDVYTKKVIDWKRLCDGMSIEAPIKSKTDPSVSVKLLS